MACLGEITLRFPIGLLQIAIKVTLEPPAGLKAGLYRTYSTMVSQELLDKPLGWFMLIPIFFCLIQDYWAKFCLQRMWIGYEDKNGKLIDQPPILGFRSLDFPDRSWSMVLEDWLASVENAGLCAGALVRNVELARLERKHPKRSYSHGMIRWWVHWWSVIRQAFLHSIVQERRKFGQHLRMWACQGLLSNRFWDFQWISRSWFGPCMVIPHVPAWLVTLLAARSNWLVYPLWVQQLWSGCMSLGLYQPHLGASSCYLQKISRFFKVVHPRAL